jgi:hypothetical protein
MTRLGKHQVCSLYAFGYFGIGMVTLAIPPVQAQIAGGQASLVLIHHLAEKS